MKKNMENNKIFNVNDAITQEVVSQIIEDQATRRVIVKESHLWFFHLYFSQYAQYPTADFQKEMFAITEDEKTKMAVIIAFRGSAKSTIMTMSFPIWAVLGKLQKKCILILSQTQQQAKTHFTNIKRELEGNELLRKDLGPFQEEADEWGSYSLVIPRYDAKIVAASSEQSIRGIRHGAHRPDLIICDDVEDLNSVKTREGRDRTYGWFKGEILPCGDLNTKTILVGNLLHEDSLLMRLKDAVEEKRIDAVFKEYPIIDSSERSLWPGKFPDLPSIKSFEKALGDDKSWQREYMLKIISDEEQVIKKEWIQYYDELPEGLKEYINTGTGIDLAISKKDSADYTAMVTVHVFGHQGNMKVFVVPNPVNERLDFATTVLKAKAIADSGALQGGYYKSHLFIEEVGYQSVLNEQLKKEHYHVEGVSPHGQDKRSRLMYVSQLFSTGKVFFPKKGCELLLQQLLYFGVEKHDDLVDALVIALSMALKNDSPKPVVMTAEIAGLLRGGGGSWYSNRGYWSGGGRLI